MKNENSIKVGIATERMVNDEFIDAWKRAENDAIEEKEEKLYYLTVKTLLSALSDKRLILLQTLRHLGDTSIKALRGCAKIT